MHKLDAEIVAASDAKELKTIKNNFLIKKLGLTDSPDLNDKIAEIMDRIGTFEGKNTAQ